jgi:predicted TIM-barrel fold metal-dependent hydrolase
MSEEIIDIHIHFGAKDEESGCYWSKEFTTSLAYIAMLLVSKFIFRKVNIANIRKHLLGVINGSEYVKKSVILALDQVYDKQGNSDLKKWTHLYVPNKYVFGLAEEYPRVLFGASVHPYRKDWRDELEYCLANKAVLCKWVPSSQMIDPANPKCIPFYKKLAEHDLPLLCHTGPENAIPTHDPKSKKFDNPDLLRPALKEGATVIAAHCALPYFGPLDKDYKKEFAGLFEDAAKYGWKLYADLSAICTPLRAPYIERIKKVVPYERLIFGSDYPIPLSEISYNKSPNFFSWLRYIKRVLFEKNPLDKNYLLIKEMGFDESIFTNAARLFAKIKYSA